MDKKRLEKEGPQTLTIYPKQKINIKSINRKIYGDAIICAYLDALGNSFSADQIVKDIRKQKCSNAADGWWLLDYRTSLTDKLYELIGEDTPKKWMSPKNMKELFHKGKKVCWKPKYTT